MLCFVNLGNVVTMKSIYYAIFIPIFHMFVLHGLRIWILNITNLLQKKAMQIISFTSFYAHTLPIFAKFNIIIIFFLWLFIYKHFLSKSSSVFSIVFILRSNTHEQNTGSASHGLLTKSSCSTSIYGTNAFAASAIKSWNFFQKKFSSNNLCQLPYSQLKLLIKNHFFNFYNQECS